MQGAETKEDFVGDLDERVETVAPVIECPPGTTDRKLTWKIDSHVLPILFLMYMMAYLGK